MLHGLLPWRGRLSRPLICLCSLSGGNCRAIPWCGFRRQERRRRGLTVRREGTDRVPSSQLPSGNATRHHVPQRPAPHPPAPSPFSAAKFARGNPALTIAGLWYLWTIAPGAVVEALSFDILAGNAGGGFGPAPAPQKDKALSGLAGRAGASAAVGEPAAISRAGIGNDRQKRSS